MKLEAINLEGDLSCNLTVFTIEPYSYSAPYNSSPFSIPEKPAITRYGKAQNQGVLRADWICLSARGVFPQVSAFSATPLLIRLYRTLLSFLLSVSC
jgi:hypothetical protein